MQHRWQWRKDDRVGVCIDYSILNKVVNRYHYPMILNEDVIHAVANSEVHANIGFKDRLFLIDVAEKSHEYLILVTSWVQFIPQNLTSFGFCNILPGFLA